MNGSPHDEQAVVSCRGGLEARLDLAAWVVLIIGLVIGGFFFLSTITRGGLPGILIGGLSWMAWLILQALAEIVRLQKRVNGLPYSGSISETNEGRLVRCAGCGAAHYETDFCPHCHEAVTE